jgi:glycosyltransferase involved in cell wall biosynthesis
VSGPVDVSVVVPTHNGAGLIRRTLSHIAAQRTSPDLRWEVIVVDNASTDGTAEVVRDAWPGDAPVHIRVVEERELGLAHAHLRGFAEARGELVSWVEDDNWIAPDWVEMAWRTMGAHPEAGACGGFNEPVCEGGEPLWFSGRRGYYACGPQGEPGDVTEDRGYLWGAGLTVRRRPWRGLLEGGFRPLLVDRRGRGNYDSGGDSEICFALRLSGWRLWSEPAMRMRHFLPVRRLEWRYLRRLLRGVGASSVGLDPYLRALGDPAAGALSCSWRREARGLFNRLWEERDLLREMWRQPLEGEEDVLELESDLGRFGALLRWRRRYDRSFGAIESAEWRAGSGGLGS